MIVKVVIQSHGEKLFDHPILVEGENDLAEGAKEAFAEFRKEFPAVSLMDEHITIAFDKA